ncbi:MAG: preprotein translocase subunit SecY [Candidatus Riflebacteria bacterium]|nr:preprotein translocase subunit SecY [Candidatus Riflebacteria bacterium]
MIETFSNAFKIRELRNRIWFTFLMVLVFRLGCQIPTPGIDAHKMKAMIEAAANSVLGFFNIFSGGALEKFSVFALGITPYINSSIIMQLLIYVIPDLERLAKEEGEEGRRKISQYTRYGTVVIGALQAFGICVWLERLADSRGPMNIVIEPGMAFKLMAVLTLTAGTAFIMWLGEQMTAMGIGNGVSILITAGIVSRLPSATGTVYHTFELDKLNPLGFLKLIGLLVIVLGVIAAVVVVQDGVRKIPVQHAKRVVGRRVYGGATTHIPLRVNQGGVIPVIFASSVMMFPTMILDYVVKMWDLTTKVDPLSSTLKWMYEIFQPGRWAYMTSEFLLIIFFTYFYTAIQLNPKEISDNLKKYGGFIPGIRAGRKTAEFIDRILNRVTLAGAIFLGLIALVPQLMWSLFRLNIYFGGTSLLIVVGVALDTVRQMESHMVTRHYQGFMR